MAASYLIRVLDADPSLAVGMDPQAWRAARRHLLAPAQAVAAGLWEPPPVAGEPLGLLIIDGLLVRRMVVGSRSSVELLGDGDVIRPWYADHDDGVPVQAIWQARQPCTLAVLDQEFASLAARWPPVLGALMERALRRSRSLALRLALAQAPSVAVRVLLVQWHLAERWGRVCPEGTVISVKTSQSLLGELVAARRQSVCLALSELQRRDLLVLRPDGRWVLRGTAADALRRCTSPAADRVSARPSREADTYATRARAMA